MLLTNNQIEQLCQLCITAGAATLPYWRTDTEVMHKEDASPLTQADLAANRILLAGLAQITPQIPIISEESCDISLQERQQWQRWWLVDPLDGTKEFIAGSEEFTVNLALVEQGQVVFGLVGVPAQQRLYYGGRDFGAWQLVEKQLTAIKATTAQSPLRVLASKRHSSPAQEQLLQELRKQTEIELVNAGSSLKFCWLAEGKADFYPRLAPTSQWDTAAAQAVLEGAGGQVLDLHGQRLAYQPRQDYLNPEFYAYGLDLVWQPSD